MTTDVISPDLTTTLRRLKLSGLLSTLPDRITLARGQKMPYQDFLLVLLSDEVSRRDGLAATLRAQRARLDPAMQLEAWDATAKVTYDKMLLNELVSMRFVEAHSHVAIVGPVGVGKTFLAHALGHIACRHGYSVLALRGDLMLKNLRHARLDNSYEAELRKLIAVDLLIVDDFGLDAMDAVESRDAYDIFTERHRAGSMIITSNRGPDEWLYPFSEHRRRHVISSAVQQEDEPSESRRVGEAGAAVEGQRAGGGQVRREREAEREHAAVVELSAVSLGADSRLGFMPHRVRLLRNLQWLVVGSKPPGRTVHRAWECFCIMKRMPKRVLPGLPERLVALRESQGLSQQVLATRAGISIPRLSQAERFGAATLETLNLLARALGVDV